MDGTIRLDLILFFFNSGSKPGLIESLDIEWKDGKKLFPEFIYIVGKDEQFEVVDIWSPFLLGAKQEKLKIIGFKSDIKIDDLHDCIVNVKIRFGYRKKLKKVRYLVDNICLNFKKIEAINYSPKYRERIAQKSN